MTYQELKQECTTAPTGRFDSATQDSFIGRLVNRWNARAWNATVWPWRVSPEQNLSVVSGTRAYAYPSDYQETWALYDELGNRLSFLPPRDFLLAYPPGSTNGRPAHYTLAGGNVLLAPTPSVTATFKWSYVKRLSHFHLGSAVTVGAMSDATDVPILGLAAAHDDYHYMLVLGANAMGLKLMQAPQSQWLPPQQEAESMLAEMVAAFGGLERGETDVLGTRVWGAGPEETAAAVYPWQ